MTGISAICFSKDRAAQLDLLLQSRKFNAPDLVQRTIVIWTASTEKYRQAYRHCQDEHEEVLFLRESDFRVQVREWVEKSSDYVMFLCDDDIFYRSMLVGGLSPQDFLKTNHDVLAVSLRLGRNLTKCYSLRAEQALPKMIVNKGFCVWNWGPGNAEFDWAYPGSLDGDIYRRTHLRVLLRDGDWSSPNELEEHLNRACRLTTNVTYMACYRDSVLLGNPINIVQTTHPNRFGEIFKYNPKTMNEAYLKGRRWKVQDLRIGDVLAAHHEVKLYG